MARYWFPSLIGHLASVDVKQHESQILVKEAEVSKLVFYAQSTGTVISGR